MSGVRPNILFVVDALTSGGAQVVMLNIVEQMSQRGYQPFVIALFEDGAVGEKLRKQGIVAKCLGVRNPFNPRYALSVINDLIGLGREYGIGIIHSLHTASGLYGGLAAKRLNARSVLSVHGRLTASKTRYIEVASRLVNEVLVPCNRMMFNELKKWAVFRRKESIKLIYNGIGPFPLSQRQYGKDGIVTLAMVANYFPEKDHLTLVKAFEIISANHDVRLLLVGRGANVYRNQVADYIEQREIKGITLVENELELSELYSMQTDIFVLSSHSEGLPIVIAEAMSAGLPVLASDVGAVNEIIDHEENGLLVPPESVDSLVYALEELMSDEALRVRLATSAHEKYNRQFTVETMADQYDNLYSELGQLN